MNPENFKLFENEERKKRKKSIGKRISKALSRDKGGSGL